VLSICRKPYNPGAINGAERTPSICLHSHTSVLPNLKLRTCGFAFTASSTSRHVVVAMLPSSSQAARRSLLALGENA
jgi:hypothetical protein